MIRAALQQVSIWAVPVMLVGITLAAMLRKVKVYEVFIEGAKEGFEVAVKIIPFLVGILVAIGMFRASGAMELLLAGLRPVATATGFPVELIPSTMIGILAAAGSQNPTAIIAPGLVATFIGTLSAVIAAKLLQPFYPAPAAAPAMETTE